MKLSRKLKEVCESIKFTDVHDKEDKNPVLLKMNKGNVFLFPKHMPIMADTVEKARNFLKDKDYEQFYAHFDTMEPYQEKDAKSKGKRLKEILTGTPFKMQGEFEPVVNVDNSISDNKYAVLVVRS